MSRTLHLFGTDWCAMMVPIQVIRWYRMQCYDGTDSCAIVVPIRRYCHENVAVSPLYGVYRPKSLAVGAYLHEYFMSEINTHNYLHPLIQKGAKNTINITNQRFLENCVLLPTNINELLQISKLLRSLNNKIKYQQDILQQYQKQKQYLLRQMFI